MTHPLKSASESKIRVPLLLPSGRDAALVARILKQEGIDVVVCASMRDLVACIGSHCGPFVVADEALSRQAAARLMAALADQQEWSSLPGIVLTGSHARKNQITQLAALRDISLIQRPIRTRVFTNLIKNAVEARSRQFQVRDLLYEMSETNQTLRSRTELLQKLSLDLIRVENRERSRIAQILHDDLQQLLASGKLRAEMLSDDSDPKTAGEVQKLYDIFADAMKISRNLSHELKPAFIVGGKFETALQTLIEKTAQTYGFEARMTGGLDSDRIADDIKLLIYRSVQELLLNCAKHAQARHVTLELIEHANTAKVVLADDGKGFEPDKLNESEDLQSGLGLFSIRERAKALGGTFEIRSQPKQGCRIAFSVPCAPHESILNRQVFEKGQAQAPTSTGQAQPKPLSVIIADDHALFRQSLAVLLQSLPGVDVVAQAADGDQAVVLALQYRPDVLIMDISMPLMDGIEATRRIKAQAPELTIIGLSAFLDHDRQQRMLHAGARQCLPKDIDAQVLIQKIQEVI